ncbi:hypothetical protein [Streptomyces sp. NPDC091278]|uniref:hypothetical protein n=1 Tax=Streptomyces sp. NPDC091278 TaxID=3155301 RepID=UPI0034503782
MTSGRTLAPDAGTTAQAGTEGDPALLSLTEGVMPARVRPAKSPGMTMLPSTRAALEQHTAEHCAPPPDEADSAPTPARLPLPSPSPSGTVPHVVGVHLCLERDGRVLLGLRHPDSAYAGGTWHTLAVH